MWDRAVRGQAVGLNATVLPPYRRLGRSLVPAVISMYVVTA